MSRLGFGDLLFETVVMSFLKLLRPTFWNCQDPLFETVKYPGWNCQDKNSWSRLCKKSRLSIETMSKIETLDRDYVKNWDLRAVVLSRLSFWNFWDLLFETVETSLLKCQDLLFETIEMSLLKCQDLFFETVKISLLKCRDHVETNRDHVETNRDPQPRWYQT